MRPRRFDPHFDPAPLARVFSIDHARAEKQRLFAGETPESDVAHERRRSHRLLDGLTWYELGVILADMAVLLFAALGFAWFVGYLIASVEAGVWR
jgi:hypothetical protein